MRPGTRWVSRETAPDGTRQKVVVRVTHRTRPIANGIRARVVRDTVTERGRLVEDTRDWYAQDADGNVWYLGERTKEYEDGEAREHRGLVRGRRRRRAARRRDARAPGPACATARSTTPATPRTARRS